ncbi:MAG TPA: flagellar hook-length control protein FliK [Deltaproteobacteria bacterium]|nr:flagellar hook-length control protein FliK [Deltaproteobacteria bacterium]
MEAIGQKAVLSSTDEVIISDELGVDSGEMGEERMFDVTLDEILAEHPLDESLLEGLLEEDSLTASLASSILTQNQANPEFVEDIFGTAELSTIPAEVLDDNLWTEETHTARSKVLNKSEPFPQELIEVLDPRVVSDENTFQNLPSQGVAETGLQSILQESDLENPESLLQTVFHQAKPPEEGAEFSEDDLQSVMQKNRNLPVQSEEDTEYSVLQKILHQVKPPEEGAEFSEDDLQTVLQTNTGQQIPIKENNSVVQGPEPVQENLEGLLQKELQTVFHQGLKGNEKDATKPVAENLVKIMPAEIPPAAEKISPEQSLQVVANTKTEKSLLAADNFKEAEEFEGGVKSKTTAGLQMTDVENLSDSAEKVSILPTEKLKAVESLKVVDNIKTSETLQTKTAETLQTKTAEVLEGGVKSKMTAGLQMTDVENLSDSAEKVLLLPTEKRKAAESLKVADSIKTSETLQSKTAEVLEGGVKEKTTAGLQTAEKFKVTEEFEGGVKEKATAGLQMNSAEKSKDISENAFKQPLNQFRSLTSKETQLSSNVKSPVDSVSAPGINAVSELSGTSILKGTEVANSPNGNLRSADLPFNMEQVVSRVRILSGNGVEEMTLRLHPEELGQITLKIRQAGGNLTIDMRVDNMLAKQIVESGFDSLRSKFLDQEFSYKDLALNVDINERDSKYGGDRKYAEFDEEMFSPERGNKEELSALEETPIVRHRTDSGLNLYV